MADKGKKGDQIPDSTTKSPNKACSVSGESAREADRRQREQDCKELSIRYSLPARVGMWYEAQCLQEASAENYEERRALCRTFYQKQDLVYEHLFAPMQIGKHEHQLKFGHAIQIQSNVTIENKTPEEKPILKLACLINEVQIETLNMLKLMPGSMVTIAYDNEKSKPVRRNVFTIISCEGKPVNSPVLYGEEIFIRVYDADTSQELFVWGAVPTLDSFGENKGRIPVYLKQNPDRYCKFSIVDSDPEKMITLKGTSVPTFESVCLNHVFSNQMLAINMNESISTMFCTDHPVEVHTFKDPNRRVTSENYWIFLTQGITETSEASEAEAGASTSHD